MPKAAAHTSHGIKSLKTHKRAIIVRSDIKIHFFDKIFLINLKLYGPSLFL